MMPEVTVACVLRSGTFRGRSYTVADVVRLQAAVLLNLSFPHRFVCLSDVSFTLLHGEVRRLHDAWPGWWSKIELFSRVLDDAKRVLYLDLDVRIMRCIDDLVLPSTMTMAPAIQLKPKPRMVRRYQSSVMCWSPPEGREIYEMFMPDPHMTDFYGDQDWIGFLKRDLPTFPREWIAKLPGPEVKVVINVKDRDHESAEPRLSAVS